MQASNARTPTGSDIGTIFVAIELSQRSWLVTMHSPERERISRHKLAVGDGKALLGLLEAVRVRAAGKLGARPPVISCYEAGYDGFWLHRLLTSAGITDFVFDPASIAVNQRARRAKTDRIDGELLLRTLMAYCRGEPRVVSVVHVPSPGQEDARRRSRERQRLVTEQTSHINRIKALLRLVGIAAGNPRRRNWLALLQAQRDWQGEEVPPGLRAEIEREHARLMLVYEQLKALSETDAAAEAPAGARQMTQQAELLRRLKGVGPAFATTQATEIF